MQARIIEGTEAKTFQNPEKWDLLSPYLRQFGREALSYATLQDGMEYFLVRDMGYIGYVSVKHPLFAPRGMKMVLVDPVCSIDNYPVILKLFLQHCPHIAFAPASRELGLALRPMGFKFVCIGYEPVIPIQTYNTRGNWKELDVIKRAHNEAKRKGITVREETDISRVDRAQLEQVSRQWLGSKVLKDREIWVYARKPNYQTETDVRKFVAYDAEGKVAGFAFYDPIYEKGQVVGYSANTSRCDEVRFGKLSTVVHMTAAEIFKAEGKQSLNLCLAPFDKVDNGEFNDDLFTKTFFKLSRKYGEKVYNFGGLSFFKSKYRAPEVSKYFASNALWPANDVYLGYWSAGIVESYSKMLSDFLGGVVTGVSKDVRRHFAKKEKKEIPVPQPENI